MKLRTGFVSNSSSQSFCIHGEQIDANSILEALGKSEDDDVRDALEEALKGTQLEYYSIDDSDIYIGRPFTTIKGNETGKQFRDSAKEDLKKVFPKMKITTSDMEEGWTDN